MIDLVSEKGQTVINTTVKKQIYIIKKQQQFIIIIEMPPVNKHLKNMKIY